MRTRVLLVPCRIGPTRRPRAAAQGPAMRMPRAWEFQIEFDDRRTATSRGSSYGDNAPYADYIKAHNHATDTSTEWVKRLIPLAEKTKVVIALENVSNNLWVKPAIFRHFVQSFQSPWVKAYYDIGNHVRFAPPEEWILTLGDLLAKIHVKDYLLDPADPEGRGTSVNIREGSVRWPVLRQALEVDELQRLDDDREQRRHSVRGAQPAARPDPGRQVAERWVLRWTRRCARPRTSKRFKLKVWCGWATRIRVEEVAATNRRALSGCAK